MRVIAALFILAAWSSPDPHAVPVTAEGWGPARVGMTLSQAVDALDGTLVEIEGSSGTEGCFYMESVRAPGMRFMVEDGTLVRVETTDPRYRTPSGVRVGQSEGQARAAYQGRVVEKPHQYVEDGYYLVITLADARRAVVLETVDGQVVELRGGLLPPVLYVEGCS